MRVYCASPYTAPTIKQVVANILHAERVGVEVRALGHVPFVPHIALPPFPAGMSIEDQWEPAMQECLSHLQSCDAILLTGDWERSKGCLAELAAAGGWRLRVFYGLVDLAEVAA